MFDVTIVGAGPAGAVCANWVAAFGLQVALIDKEEFPRDKPCGGGISTRICTRFPHLQAELQKIPVNWVNQVQVESPNGTCVTYQADDPLYAMVRRVEFDELLLSMVSRRVTKLLGVAVTDVTFEESQAVLRLAGGQTIMSRLVVAADGANSLVARVAGLGTPMTERSDWAIDMREETPLTQLRTWDQSTMYVAYGRHGHYGYGYIFPGATHTNMGIGYQLEYYLNHFGKEHYQHHTSFVEEMTGRELVSGQTHQENFRAFPIPISGPFARTYAHRLLLCGDAGGFVNAFTAEGIYYAMVSGELAGRQAVAAIKAGDYSARKLAGYQGAWRYEIGEELRHSVSIQRALFSDPTQIDAIIAAARRKPRLAKIMAEYASGQIGHRKLIGGLLTFAPGLLVRELVRRIRM